MASRSSLYPSKSTPLSKPASSSSTNSSSLAFTASLSSLLATSASASSSQTRPRPSKTPSTQPRDSIFTSHVRNTNNKKRPLHEPSSSKGNNPAPQKHAKTSESIDAATLARSRRKMEEKARLYASMKRGDYVPPTDGRGRDKEAEGLIDFDRKWAESADADKDKDNNNNTSSDAYSDSEPDEAGQETVEYTDEFGRLRTGTARDAAREQRRQHAAAYATSSLSESLAHPPPPSTLIHGDTVQTAAFNPSATLTAQMAGLAAKRDRSATPPEEVHYDANSEVRAKGVGFFQFSRDKGGRGREMEGLEAERAETERRRAEGEREKEGRREERRRRLEERRRVVEEKKGERRVERFLEELDAP